MADEFEAMPTVRVPARLRRVVDADDLRQAAMLRLYERGLGFQDRTDAERRAYLRRSLASALIDELRRAGRARRCGDRAEVAVEEMPGDTSTPSRKAMRNERRARLVGALADLPGDQRAAITLHHLQGRTLAETAEAMDKTIPSVAGLIRRALPALRQRLAELGGA